MKYVKCIVLLTGLFFVPAYLSCSEAAEWYSDRHFHELDSTSSVAWSSLGPWGVLGAVICVGGVCCCLDCCESAEVRQKRMEKKKEDDDRIKRAAEAAARREVQRKAQIGDQIVTATITAVLGKAAGKFASAIGWSSAGVKEKQS